MNLQHYVRFVFQRDRRSNLILFRSVYSGRQCAASRSQVVLISHLATVGCRNIRIAFLVHNPYRIVR